MAKTAIPWAHYTFNPIWGCQKVSPGCAHCYAEQFAQRVYGKETTMWRGDRMVASARTWNQPHRWNEQAERAGIRRRVFCASMGDIFEDHPAVAAERAKLWPLIRATPALDWLLLTKRPELIRQALPSDWGHGYLNVWLGTSIETQEYIGRLTPLIGIPARVRFVSAEPLLGPVVLSAVAPLNELSEVLDWVIVGGESGNAHRPMSVGWAVSLQWECAEAGIPFFFKQVSHRYPDRLTNAPETLQVRQFPASNAELQKLAGWR